MIERLLAAEAALANGELEAAGRLFGQVAEADPRNAIAVVGLARIARWEGRVHDARSLAERALAIDPDEAAAQRLLRQLYAEASPDGEGPAGVEASPAPTPAPTEPQWPTAPAMPAARTPSLLTRLRRWLTGRRGPA